MPNKQDLCARRSKENGNAFIFVLLGVVLFAALMYSFSRGVRQGDSNLSSKKSVIAAQDIVGLGQRIERAVNNVLASGCSENYISFENNVFSDYTNTNAPTDLSCHVFSQAGGSINLQKPDPIWFDSTFKNNVSFNKIIFSGNTSMEEIGDDDAAELILWIPYIHPLVCENINKMVQIDGIPNFVAGPHSGFQFNGSYTKVNENTLSKKGLRYGCIEENDNINSFARTQSESSNNEIASGSYHYFHILSAR
jgi:hypothetical protein